MARVFRQQYTRPIPEGAQRTTAKVKRHGKEREVAAVRFRGEDGKWVVAPVVESGRQAGTHCRVNSPNYYGRVNGKPVCLCTNRQAAETMLADLIRKKERGEVGLADPFAEHKKRPLSEHLADFRKSMETQGTTTRQVDLVIGRMETLFAGCGFASGGDIDEAKVADWLASRRAGTQPVTLPDGRTEFTVAETARLLGITPESVGEAVRNNRLVATGKGPARRLPRQTVQELLARRTRGISIKTSNHYLTALRAFCRWMVRSRRLPENPVAHLETGNSNLERRRDRRELGADELRDLLRATRASKKKFRGLRGEDRFHLYALACGSGFRAGGLASLTPECFDLDGKVPVVKLPVRTDKSRRGKIQPLPADVADLMRAFLVGKPAGHPLWPGTWATRRKACQMLRFDLDAAGIPYEVQGPDGPLYADFHALRHTYLTLGGRAGIDLRTLQELAGHSTPVLTARYSHRRLHDLAGAVEKLPDFLPSETTRQPQSLAATGTEGSFAYTPLTQKSDGERGNLIQTESADGVVLNREGHLKACTDKNFDGEQDRKTETDGSQEEGEKPREPGTRPGFSRSQALSGKEVSIGQTDPLHATYTQPMSDMPSDLARVVTAWPDLPLPIRVAILSLVEANQGK